MIHEIMQYLREAYAGRSGMYFVREIEYITSKFGVDRDTALACVQAYVKEQLD